MQIIESLDSFSISNEAVVGLLKGVASILGRFPPERIKTDMKKLCLSQVRNLQKLMEVSLKVFVYNLNLKSFYLFIFIIYFIVMHF